jgi:hypothetical protein
MPNTAAEPLTTYNCYYVPLCEVWCSHDDT